MSQTDCGEVRELIPDVGAGRADPEAAARVESHVAGCSECAGELDLARALFASRARMPVDVSDTVVRRLRREDGAGTSTRPWWGISAAAVAALALGIGITSGPGPDSEPYPGVELVVEAEDDEFWLSDDGVLAGAPVFETLSDEALAELLDELTTLQGGQA